MAAENNSKSVRRRYVRVDGERFDPNTIGVFFFRNLIVTDVSVS